MTTQSQLEAYAAIKETEESIKADILMLFTKGNYSADEVARLLDINLVTARARVCDLRSEGALRETGAIDVTNCGKSSTVYELIPVEERKPVKKKLKPVGDPELWGEMLRLAYTYANDDNHITKCDMELAAIEWINAFSKGVRV